jgi:hypothetical protein
MATPPKRWKLAVERGELATSAALLANDDGTGACNSMRFSRFLSKRSLATPEAVQMQCN